MTTIGKTDETFVDKTDGTFKIGFEMDDIHIEDEPDATGLTEGEHRGERVIITGHLTYQSLALGVEGEE